MAANVATNNGELQRNVMYVKRWIRDTCADQFSGHHPVFAKLREKKRIFAGSFGDSIVVPMYHPAAGGPEARGVVDPLVPETPRLMTGIIRSVWPIAEVMINCVIPRRELRADRPPAKMVDYQGTVWDLTMKRFLDKLIEWLWAPEGNAYSAGTESQITSLLTLLNKGGTSSSGPVRPYAKAAQYCANNDSIGWTSATHGSAAGTSPVTLIAGIERNQAGNVYFCVPVLNPASATTFGRTPINNTLTLSRRGRDAADLGIFDANHYDALQDILQGQQQLRPSKLQEYGFAAIQYNGVDMTYDDEMPVGAGGGTTGQFLALNTDQMGFYADGSFEPDVIEAGASAREPTREYMLLGYYGFIAKLLGRGLGARHANIA